jgi:hypothetical protein
MQCVPLRGTTPLDSADSLGEVLSAVTDDLTVLLQMPFPAFWRQVVFCAT